jgi:hypothetical protein
MTQKPEVEQILADIRKDREEFKVIAARLIKNKKQKQKHKK